MYKVLAFNENDILLSYQQYFFKGTFNRRPNLQPNQFLSRTQTLILFSLNRGEKLTACSLGGGTQHLGRLPGRLLRIIYLGGFSDVRQLNGVCSRCVLYNIDRSALHEAFKTCKINVTARYNRCHGILEKLMLLR